MMQVKCETATDKHPIYTLDFRCTPSDTLSQSSLVVWSAWGASGVGKCLGIACLPRQLNGDILSFVLFQFLNVNEKRHVQFNAHDEFAFSAEEAAAAKARGAEHI